MSHRNKARLEQLKRKLDRRTNHDGAPYPGFEKNIEEIRREIERLEHG